MDQPASRRAVPPSRLPRRVNQYQSVADLVRRYQDYLPPQGVQELTRTALAPHYPPSESEQEYTPKHGPRSILRNRGRNHSTLVKKMSVSDFEHSYAANVAPRHLTHRARAHQIPSRLAAGIASSVESNQVSRRVSPEKQASDLHVDGESTIKATQASSPPAGGSKVHIAGSKAGKGKAPNRLGTSKDKPLPTRQNNLAAPGRSTLRRSSFAPGSKVSGLAKQFEKINKETERSQRRYSVIRGRRARPVTTARARVQVLESVKDAIRDDDESSDSSEADDEGGDGEEEESTSAVQTPAADSSQPTVASLDAVAEADTPPAEGASDHGNPASTENSMIQEKQESSVPALCPEPATESAISVPPSPLLAAFPGLRQPPPHELDLGGPSERHSILRALSGFWGQQPFHRGRTEMDGDDPMADPEHIIRDSSMVVRTDEPTSIIALALK
jgi:1-phosphatidylinositol-3-phosphate 5-kinase